MSEPVLKSMFSEDEDGGVIGFMCITDYECELGANSTGTTVYPSEEALRRHMSCADECGIVKVRVTAVEIVAEGTDPH